MTTPLSLLLLALLISTVACSPADTSSWKPVFIPYPEYGSDTIRADPAWLASMLSDFAGIDTIMIQRFMQVNLDDDVANEYLMVIDTGRSRDESSERFLVIDSTANGFKTIANQPVQGSVDGPPVVGVFRDSISFPVFYVDLFGSRGSGQWFRYLKTFRLANGSAYKGPEIVINSYLGIGGDAVNQSAESEVVQTSAESITAIFHYKFFPNYYDLDTLKRTGRCPENPPSTIDDSATVIYRWNSSQHTFVPDYVDSKLSDAKMECLMELGADDRFRSAFRTELEQLIRTGNPCQRAMAEFFLHGKMD